MVELCCEVTIGDHPTLVPKFASRSWCATEGTMFDRMGGPSAAASLERCEYGVSSAPTPNAQA